MSGDEDAAVLDGVVAADETQAHQERVWKVGDTFQSQLKEKSDGVLGLLYFFVKIQLTSSRHVRFGDSVKVSVMP